MKNQQIDKEKIESRIDGNREEIHRLLEKDVPLELLYLRIKMLSSQNEKLIEKLKGLNQKKL